MASAMEAGWTQGITVLEDITLLDALLKQVRNVHIHTVRRLEEENETLKRRVGDFDGMMQQRPSIRVTKVASGRDDEGDRPRLPRPQRSSTSIARHLAPTVLDGPLTPPPKPATKPRPNSGRRLSIASITSAIQSSLASISSRQEEVLEADEVIQTPTPQGGGTANAAISGTVTSSPSRQNSFASSHKGDSLPFEAPTMYEHLHDTGSRCPGLQRFVAGPRCDGFFCSLILLNALAIAGEAQFRGWQVGYDLGYPNAIASEDEWSWGGRFFDVSGWVFGIAFLFEIVLKISVLGSLFFKGMWNIFDSIIAVFWILEVAETPGNYFDPSLLRIIRLVKLLRLVRLVRTIQAFDALYLMTTALAGSATILAWSAALLIVLLMMFALLANQVLVETYLQKEDSSLEDRLAVYEYFGTFSRSLLSLFEITLANWPPVCRLLVEKVSEAYLIPALLHKLAIGFAVVGVINGVFMQETFKVAATDDNIMLRQKITALRMHEKKMRLLFARLDETGDGSIDEEEFAQVVTDRKIMTWLASMDLNVEDTHAIYGLIKNEQGQVSADDLIRGVARLQGTARSIDLALAMREQSELRTILEDVLRGLKFLGLPPVTPDGQSAFIQDHVRADGWAPQLSEEKPAKDKAEDTHEVSTVSFEPSGGSKANHGMLFPKGGDKKRETLKKDEDDQDGFEGIHIDIDLLEDSVRAKPQDRDTPCRTSSNDTLEFDELFASEA